MLRPGEVVRRLLFLVRRRRFESDLAREMAFHLEMQAADNHADGMEEDEARHAARRQFGNATRLHEMSREAWGWTWLDRLGQDLRFAVRACHRNPVFTTVTIAILAVAIAGNTVIFSLANALVLNPFPYPEADRLVTVESAFERGDWQTTVSIGSFFAWQQAREFEALAAYGWSRPNVSADGLPGFEGPERMVAGRATASFLRVLRVAPAVGRYFTAEEDRPDGAAVLLLGYGLWQRRFGGRADVLGRSLVLDGPAPMPSWFPGPRTSRRRTSPAWSTCSPSTGSRRCWSPPALPA
jgi:putative ABC transport system permease protein